jgi:hypothetical protein
MSIIVPDRATLKICKIKQVTTDGVATVLLKVPGEVGEFAARIIEGGHAYFNNHHADDFVQIYLSDEDDILGYGVGTVVGSYTDTDVDQSNIGWFIPPSGVLAVGALGGLGHLTGGLYLKVIATKGDLSSDTFRCNIIWGTKE